MNAVVTKKPCKIFNQQLQLAITICWFRTCCAWTCSVLWHVLSVRHISHVPFTFDILVFSLPFPETATSNQPKLSGKLYNPQIFFLSIVSCNSSALYNSLINGKLRNVCLLRELKQFLGELRIQEGRRCLVSLFTSISVICEPAELNSIIFRISFN